MITTDKKGIGRNSLASKVIAEKLKSNEPEAIRLRLKGQAKRLRKIKEELLYKRQKAKEVEKLKEDYPEVLDNHRVLNKGKGSILRKSINVRFTLEDYEEMESLLKGSGVSKGAFVRLAVAELTKRLQEDLKTED